MQNNVQTCPEEAHHLNVRGNFKCFKPPIFPKRIGIGNIFCIEEDGTLVMPKIKTPQINGVDTKDRDEKENGAFAETGIAMQF